jgi:hypothetical protein
VIPFGLPDGFFDSHWRRRPLHLRGGAAAFLPQAPSREQIFAAVDAGAPHQSDGASVWFLEGLTDGFPGLADLVAQARRLFEWHDIWCDVFATLGPSSIGCHYDGSDNFSIQLTGNKEWFLCPPDRIHPDDRRRRLLGEPGLGPAPVPETALRFDVRAGDVLYIPSTWVHWGLSDGDSTSVSLVVNVAAPLHVLQAQILDGLRHDPGWSTPLPVGPGSTAARRRVLGDLVEGDLPVRLRPQVTARLADREGGRLSPKGLYPDRRTPSSCVDIALVDEYVGGAADLAGEPGPLDGELLARVARVHARRNLGRLLEQCALRPQQTSDEDARRIYLAVAAVLPTLPHDVLDGLLNDPDVHSWLGVAERDTRLTRGARAEDPLANALGLALLPDLARAGSPPEPLAVTVAVDEDGGLTLRRAGLRLYCPDRPDRVTVGVLDGALHHLGPAGATPLVEGVGGGGVEVVPLAVVGDGAVAVSTACTDWLRRVFGTAVPGGYLPADAMAVRTGRTGAAVAAVCGVPEPDPFLSWVLVRDGDADGAEPVVRGMRGLAVTAGQDLDRLTAAISRARARHEIDALADLVPLVAGEPGSARRAVHAELVRAYVRARAGRWDTGADDAAGHEPAGGVDPSTLTPWGVAVLDAVHALSA